MSAEPNRIDQATSEHKGLSYLLMTGHFCTDLCQGALVATFPFLVVYSGFTYTEVAMLVFAANVVSAIIQPLFGWMSDRKARPWLMALGCFLAGFGLAGVGLMSNYLLIIASAMVSGCGVAMFHPEGGRLANLVASKQKGTSMSIFAVGGNVGWAIGPMVAVASIGFFGISGTFVPLIPAAIVALVLLTKNRTFGSFGLVDKSVASDPDQKEHWGFFTLVMAVVSTRSVGMTIITTYAALFLMTELGQSEQIGSLMITIYALFGAVATISSGKVSGRIGVQRLMQISYTALSAVIILFAFCRILPLSAVLIACIGLLQSIAYPSTVVLGQSFIPHHLGTASGLTYGVAICIGGLLSPLFGMIGDAIGLTPVILMSAGVVLVGACLSFVLAHLVPNTKLR